LLTRIATTESVSLCERMKKLTAFLELESQLVKGDGFLGKGVFRVCGQMYDQGPMCGCPAVPIKLLPITSSDASTHLRPG